MTALGLGTAPFVEDAADTYTDADRLVVHWRAYQWNHGIGEMVTALARHGGELALARPTKADRDAFLAKIRARFGQPDPESLARVNAVLDQHAAMSGKQPVA